MQQAQGQLGFEGFTMGTMYLAVGTTLAGLTFGAPIISNSAVRRIVSIGLFVCFAFFAWKVLVCRDVAHVLPISALNTDTKTS